MKVSAPPLLPILRSKAQAKLLTALFMDPEREFTISELAAIAETSLPTAAREVSRAAKAGIVTHRSLGRNKLVRVERSTEIYEPLGALLLRAFGPAAVVAEAFAGVAGIERLFVFGSWAARYGGEPGRGPRDIDVLVIGSPNRKDAYAAADRVEQRLRMPVQVVMRTAEQWERPSSDPFLRHVRDRPLVEIERGNGRSAA